MRIRTCVILAAIFLIPIAAQAQTVAGVDPATALQAILNWLVGPVGRAIVTLALMAGGALLMVGRHTFEGLFFIGAGSLFFLGAPAIVNILAP